ncbi:geranylgeranylglycerol-phosphate geranylgeranyltransferase [Flavobacterium lacus]|uniref:4-hydroxybenzoate polyprenyltransferase n=1 Tax=Flavobacterium lacus TaxID=1353778 RepID=A0A328WL53_9FLAO|nr:geranylgeranylglycerol-phosphate geranylgeranyltransferase [Flavobacterium lacus]RAR46960.1 4-hydroxybenzoate polyprenyltransferase [Flavobacterium lacus]
MIYLKLIRYKNLLLLAFMQLIFRYGFLKQQDGYLALADWHYFLLVLSTVLLAAAGYVINDIFDQETDIINRPDSVIVGKSISESRAYNIYVGLNIAGVAIGFYLSNLIEKPSFATIFIFIAACLYFYATTLKKMLLLGNLLVAFILGLSVLIIGVFDLYPATYDGNRDKMALLFKILTDYAIFAFFLNFIREIIKDCEDVKGDYNQGMQTLPIILGIARTGKIIFVLLAIASAIISWYINQHLMSFDLYYAVLYVLFLVLGPLLFALIKCWNAKTNQDFKALSLTLKWVIFFGILSIAVITFNIKMNTNA